MTPVLSANGRKTPIKNDDPYVSSARRSVTKASGTQSVTSTSGSAFKQSITSVKMPGQAKIKIPDLYSQIAKQQKKLHIKSQQVTAKPIKQREPITQEKRIPLKNVQVKQPKVAKSKIITLPILDAFYDDDLSEKEDPFKTIEAEENRQFLCLTTLMTESSQLLNLASNFTDKKDHDLFGGELQITDLCFNDISKIQNTRGQRSTAFTPELSGQTSPKYSTARDMKVESKDNYHTSRSGQSSKRRDRKQRKLTKVCKVDELIQIFQEQPSPEKKKKSVNQLIRENMHSRESTLKEYKQFLKDESFSPKMGRITNKLRSESQEALQS